MEIGILRRRAASEKLLASTTLANTTSELRSAIAFPIIENSRRDRCLTVKEAFAKASRIPGRTAAAALEIRQ